ncbi:hypothetical protein [uncultured Mailhella sp.]|uniref:hypothetical protein n=1 Tax=uncultured Mailhella sp. TaxID=1981031 RepID=UPI0025E29AD8|nr:hypothetical protein [uncultured Mailhella sp.]
MKASRLFTPLALLACLCTSSVALAADDAPKKAERRTPVVVEFEGNDSIGVTLFNSLQKKINSTNPASPAREAKFRILLSTASEFPSRPGVGSVYAVVWTLALSEGSMEYYLVRDLGIVTPDTVDEVTDRIVSRTDGVSARYGYLDRDK